MGQQELIKVIVAGTVIILALGICIIFFALFYKRRQQKYKLEKMQIDQKFREETLLAQLEIQEQTLRNISLEIHDNINQALSLAKLHLSTLDIEDNASREQKLVNTKDLVSKAITDLRSLSKTMNAEIIISAGVLKAIEYELGLINKGGSFITDMKITGTIIRLDGHKELILFRIVQEVLNNIIKHAEASNIWVKAHYGPSNLEMCIEDDGKGFRKDVVANEMERGSGLSNMKSRASVIGGTLDIHSNKGTKIKITIPINES